MNPDIERMLAAIRRDARQTADDTGQATLAEPVLDAMRAVAREEFVPEGAQPYAYENMPLPIGRGQTISQPFIVALMTDLLQPRAGQRVLEIGTGSGYQAAVLAQLQVDVYSIEIVPELASAAAERLARLGYQRVHVRAGDGWHGWPEAAPFDGIILTAVGERIPPMLVEQLAPGGRMVLPLGPELGRQTLVVVEKDAAGKLISRDVLAVQFVPLTGGH
ncbi:MAG: protein-L-isoaspartate(D-aspartate) O-methyltransferase [Pseudomonadales bacterium]